MATYVDNMRRPAQLQGRPAKWSHLLADTTEELLEFAAHLGLKMEWIQKAGTCHEHFDVTDEVRSRALRMGAVRMIYPHETGRYVLAKRARFKRDAAVRLARATAALCRETPRDTYGYEISIDRLEVFAQFVLDNHAGLTMAELTDVVILAMLTGEPDDMPTIAEGYDAPADDDHIETLVQIMFEAIGIPLPEPGVRNSDSTGQVISPGPPAILRARMGWKES
jgi:hypothetical protein